MLCFNLESDKYLLYTNTTTRYVELSNTFILTQNQKREKTDERRQIKRYVSKNDLNTGYFSRTSTQTNNGV